MLQQQFKQFLLYLTVEKNASPFTVASYLADIENFFEFAKLQGVSEALFDDINHMFIRTYLGNLKAQGYSQRTIARRIASLRSFFVSDRNNVITDNPAKDIRTPKIEKRPPVYLDYCEINIYWISLAPIRGMRDAAILGYCMLQVAYFELIGLTVNDVDY